ncbi:transcriptional repressor [Desulfurispirillum indicum]|uniref:Ferric-uptake regulator n=1 Tax=Desulfurispirillum indicum (strain ATCC BAA-1389 / DSM 22839 / S5) TaxID=653733 RepID=E6W4C7_DESIS|nr:transcriptional repressor [Desulfurispirillum indicum]ADU65901.1 ferric-uptake regulator [Desulfurispirillum indicum S5]UCZ57836.1 transcriptional repressor [Desulfurispirillum indicum]
MQTHKKSISEITSSLRDKGMKMTQQRRVILDVLRSTKQHPSAEWIYNQVRKIIPNVSLGTVYRNLNTLQQEGLVLEMNYGKGQSRYDGTVEPHYHVRCIQCGRIDDVEFDTYDHLHDQVESRTGFSISEHRLEFSGICPDCTKSV